MTTNLVKKFYELDKTATVSQLYILLSIAENEGSRQSSLPPYSMSQSVLSRIVTHLTLGLGLVDSSPDPTDTRQRILTLTKDGRDFFSGKKISQNYLSTLGRGYIFCGRASDAEPLVVSFHEGVR
jgi:DNA-binding MarR family transcriptional regulator